MIQYILQTILFQLIFLMVYEFFLKKETFFNWNRAYLLLTSILSFVLPLIKIQAFSKVVPQQYIYQLPTVVIGDVAQEEMLLTSGYKIAEISQGFQWQWEYLLWFGIVFSLVLLLTKITKIFGVIRSNRVLKQSNISLVKLKNSTAAFSFFNYVFIGENIEEKEQDIILKHELVHVQQKHSLDLLFFEILRVLFWYNPLIYIYQSKLRVLHEFIADKEALKTQDKATYYQNLLTQIFDTQNVSFINTFYRKSLIKKRIVMLQKSKSSQLKRTKYLMLIPMVFVMLVYTACTNEVIAQTEKKNAESKSAILNKIDELKDEIAKKGNMTEEEERALKTLMMLITEDGLNNEFFKDVVQYAEIPFGVIENIPTYKECENLSQDEQRKCVSQKVSAYVSKGFNIKLAESLNLKGQQRINVIFKIDNTGQVTSVRARAPHPELEKEAVRVVSSLPRFIPGQHDGKKVTVPYSLPIVFQIAEKKQGE